MTFSSLANQHNEIAVTETANSNTRLTIFEECYLCSSLGSAKELPASKQLATVGDYLII